MTEHQQSLEALQDIKKMMERSSRFISLSGLSGVGAGVCALVGAWVASNTLKAYNALYPPNQSTPRKIYHWGTEKIVFDLIQIAFFVLIAAIAIAFLFTWLKSKKTGMPVWGSAARRLLWNTLLPLLVGSFCILRMLQFGYYDLVAPSSLLFYGLALVNASKYTLGEVRYLGYGQLILGIINLWMPGEGLLFWAMGFGILHIIYGALMWWKYERKEVV
ncbi:MAG: hypothetical protein EAZ16_01795 [Sphingobacteriales bacterium]|jgi:hypothetical protein|nr:MAG: hypothetical protein EAZ16_01795 [Sphingobacteriales bacterium]